MTNKYVIGVDFGSDSVRAVLVDTVSGHTINTKASEYRRWKAQMYCDGSSGQYRQHPLDYLESLEAVLKGVLEGYENLASMVAGIAVDTTGSTVCPVDEHGTPLALLKEFTDEPDAMFQLWKDHTAVKEAALINDVLSGGETDYTRYQGKYSSEWFWAKILRTVRENPAIRERAYCWTEHADWIAGILCGETRPDHIAHCSCAAGHKALWHSAFGGLPDRNVLSSIDPYLGMIRDRYMQTPKCAGEKLGTLCREWAERTGLPENLAVGMGSFDAHAGAVGAGISEKVLVKVVGTSTVDMMIVKPDEILCGKTKDYCGMAENSIVPGYIGIEAGQSAFGDIYAWFKRLLIWPIENLPIPDNVIGAENRKRLADWMTDCLLREIEATIEDVPDDQVLAVDWFNGRRYPELNDYLCGALTGLRLGTEPPSIYRALVKATVFGSRKIRDTWNSVGLKFEKVICVGGIALKSPYVMQMMSNVLNVPIMVSGETETCARGAAIYAAVAAGVFDSIESAQELMCEHYQPTYYPDQKQHEILEEEYHKYCLFADMTEKMKEI